MIRPVLAKNKNILLNESSLISWQPTEQNNTHTYYALSRISTQYEIVLKQLTARVETMRYEVRVKKIKRKKNRYKRHTQLLQWETVYYYNCYCNIIIYLGSRPKVNWTSVRFSTTTRENWWPRNRQKCTQACYFALTNKTSDIKMIFIFKT